MSASGPKQTPVSASHTSAISGKADIPFLREVAFVVAIGGKADVTFFGANVRL
jgi:hypothetical protein